jgi:repressor LexA
MAAAKLREKLNRKKPKPADVSPRQQQMLSLMLRCLLSGYLPSYRELCEEMNIASPNGVVCHLKALEGKGYLEIAHNQGYQLTDKALDLVL